MSATIFISMVMLFFLLLFSACFSASETAIFSLSAFEIEYLKKTQGKAGTRIQKMLETPRQVLITILFGNTLVNILFFSLSTVLTFSIKDHYGETKVIWVGGMVSLASVILFGEVLPKAIALKKPIPIARFTSFLLIVCLNLFRPVITSLDRMTHLLCKVVGAETKDKYITRDEIKLMLSMSEKEGIINPKEYEMLIDALALKHIKVKEVMVPRVDIIKISMDASREEIVSLLAETKINKLPVYGKDEEDIRGILYAKEFLLSPSGTPGSFVHRIPFVPESMDLENLLMFLQTQGETVSLVVDEYGGIEGLVTIEDILEELVGEIEDEYDNTLPLIKEVEESRYRVSGKLPMKEWCDFFQKEDPGYGCDTISGLITLLLQRLPKKGDQISYENMILEVIELQHHRISELFITITK